MIKHLTPFLVHRLLLLFFLAIHTIGNSCTVVIAWDGEKVLVGNNEDWFDLNAKYWLEPSDSKSKYDAVFFGFKKDGKFAQGGMNSQGLFFDGLYIDKVKLEKSTRMGKKAAPQHVFKKMLHNAGTVQEALDYLDAYFIPFIKSAQIVIADRNGDYAILNVNGITRRRLEKEKHVLISNFPAEEITPQTYSDPLFDEALNLLETTSSLTHDIIKNTLEICHQDGKAKSIYSNVFDLTNQRITNYYLFDYDRPYVIDLKNKVNCEAGTVYYFKELFPDRFAFIEAREEEK